MSALRTIKADIAADIDSDGDDVKAVSFVQHWRGSAIFIGQEDTIDDKPMKIEIQLGMRQARELRDLLDKALSD